MPGLTPMCKKDIILKRFYPLDVNFPDSAHTGILVEIMWNCFYSVLSSRP